MPYYDVYCMLSGIAAGGWAGIVSEYNDETQAIVNGLVERLVSDGGINLPSVDELTKILMDTMTGDGHAIVGQRWGDTAAAFGPAHQNQDTPTYFRFCKDKSRGAWFYKSTSSGGEWTDQNIFIDQDCAFMFPKCWYYFQSWLDVLPPGMQDGTPFAQALWDIVKRFVGVGLQRGIHFGLDYGAMASTYWGQKHYFWGLYDNDIMDMEERISQKLDIYCLDNAPNLTEAISQGLRGQRLMPALYKDLGTWIFEDPDMWPPCVQTEYGPTFQVFQTPNTLETTEPNLWTLPLDILFEVLLNLSLIDVLNTSAICKPMRNYLLAEKVFISLLRKMVLHGSLRWIQPCGAVEGEVKSARKDLLSWIGTDDLHDHIKDPLLDAKFPILHFVHACYKSDSMKSRKRLWGIAKQLEGTWNPDFASAPKAASSDEEPDSELEDYSD